MKPKRIYYEPQIAQYPLGRKLQNKYFDVQWVEIENHNNIDQLRSNPNSEFLNMKQYLIIGVRKTHKYVKNNKTSDFLVPYTSSGCTAACLYCYLVCNYNKCSYLRLFVNREMMLNKIKRTVLAADNDLVLEIGSNSDLVLENTITGNLEWTIEEFGRLNKGYLTLPTKFSMVKPLLSLKHNGRVIIRMSVNPQKIINKVELGTASLSERIKALNMLAEAGYKTGILLAPVILVPNWRKLYYELLDILERDLTPLVKRQSKIEIIFMTYSYIHRMINREAFPEAPDLFDQSRMKGRGRGRYCYNAVSREEAENFLRQEVSARFGNEAIAYIS